MSEDEARARLELLGHLLERLIATNSFFITAGYGTFFGIWAITKDQLSDGSRIWACLFLLMSATLFIGWHLMGLVTMNRVIASIGKEPAEGYANAVMTALRVKSASLIERLGLTMTLAAAVLGAIGVLILGTGLIRSL